MTKNVILSEEEKDRLQELMNVSYGSAAAALSRVIDKFITLNVPFIKILNIKDFKDYMINKMGDGVFYISKQSIFGDLNGETMFLMDKNSVYNLGSELEFDEEKDDESELEDIVLEVSNIVSTTTISNLSNLMDSDIRFCPPSIEIVSTIPNFKNYQNEYKHIIIISTDINFEEQNIKGELMILSNDDSINYIKEKINKMLEEYN